MGHVLAFIDMTPEERERMNSLCIRIQEEKDHRRFESLLRDLNALIRRKELRFAQLGGSSPSQHRRTWKTVSGVVQKVLRDVYPARLEKVEILLLEAEDLFREVRIENAFTDADGRRVALKQGTHVDVTFEADDNGALQQGDGPPA
jgi:hypothetical protein